MSLYKNFFIKSFQLDSTLKSKAKKQYGIKKLSLQNEINQAGNIIASYAYYYVKSLNPNLEYKEHYSFIYPHISPTLVITIYITKTDTNHPYMFICDFNSPVVNFFLPFGNGYRQIDFSYLDASINGRELSKLETTLLAVFFEQSILIRKNTMLRINQFSLLNCSNISNCVKKMNEIKRMRINLVKKKALQEQYNNFYQEKAVKFLMKYFELLEKEDYNEAFLFLRGEKGKYFGKERLNTFFKNSKQIVGHLQIYISLFKYKHQLHKLSK